MSEAQPIIHPENQDISSTIDQTPVAEESSFRSNHDFLEKSVPNNPEPLIDSTDSPKLSNTLTRLQYGIPAAFLVILATLFAPREIAVLLIWLVSLLAVREFQQLLLKEVSFEKTLPLFVGVTILTLGAYFNQWDVLALLLGIIFLGTMIYYLIVLPSNVLSDMAALGWTCLGLFWLGGGALSMVFIRNQDNGNYWFLFFLMILWVNDSFSFFGGKLVGKHKLAPHISPNKTLEGALMGLFGSFIFGLLVSYLMDPLKWWMFTLIAVFVAMAGQLGDLFESKIKRLCQAKDSGTLLPGHGGILDRMDSLLIGAPVFYVILKLMVL